MELTDNESLVYLNKLLKEHGNVPLDILIERVNVKILKLKGNYFPCEKCNGVGSMYIKKIVEQWCSLDEAIESAGWAGSMYPQYHKVDRENIETIQCDICSGKGYTESEKPKKDIEIEESRYDYIKRIILSEYKKIQNENYSPTLGLGILLPIPYNDYRFIDFDKLLTSIKKETKIDFNYKIKYKDDYCYCIITVYFNDNRHF